VIGSKSVAKTLQHKGEWGNLPSFAGGRFHLQKVGLVFMDLCEIAFEVRQQFELAKDNSEFWP